MIVQCSQCNKRYDLDESHLSKGAIKVRCPNCEHVWVVKVEFRTLGAKAATTKEKDKLPERHGVPAPTFPKLLPVEDLITLRAIVGFLGEKPQFGWWGTDFLGETGQKFLSIIFPRTAFSAGVNSVTEAARRLHDSRIGKGRVYHLFRMPEMIEQLVHKRLADFEPSILMPSLKTKESALEKLQSMSDSSQGAGEGPVQLGTAKNILQLTSLKSIAKQYADAFENDKQTLPYFTES